MKNEYMVFLDKVDKTFKTGHLLARDEEEKRRLWHTRRVHAVNQVEFGIRRGQIFGLLGPNGAGKTTIVKMLSGLVRPDSGKLYIDGLHVETNRFKVLRRVGAVLEGTRTCIWPLTPLENLAYFGNLRDVRGKVLKQRSRELLEFIGLKEKMDVQVRRLSRGQKQKLAICIALVTDPQVLLLDEPTTGLDVESSRAIKDKIIQMTRELGKTVLVTTHDMHVAQELCDVIGIINKGKLVTCKPKEELLELFADNLYEFALDHAPAVNGLLETPGVLDIRVESAGDGPLCVARFDQDAAARSQALYRLIDEFRAQGLQLRSITPRQTNLESIFLRLTSDKE